MVQLKLFITLAPGVNAIKHFMGVIYGHNKKLTWKPSQSIEVFTIWTLQLTMVQFKLLITLAPGVNVINIL